MFLPTYRGFVGGRRARDLPRHLVLIERTKLGAYLRAATENPTLVRAFGINVPRLITLTYGAGRGARRAGGRAGGARSSRSRPLMGINLVMVVFAVVVIGGMGSIMGSIVTGFGLGADRGPDQGVLSAGLQHRDLRRHGARAADQAGRPVRARPR